MIGHWTVRCRHCHLPSACKRLEPVRFRPPQSHAPRAPSAEVRCTRVSLRGTPTHTCEPTARGAVRTEVIGDPELHSRRQRSLAALHIAGTTRKEGIGGDCRMRGVQQHRPSRERSAAFRGVPEHGLEVRAGHVRKVDDELQCHHGSRVPLSMVARNVACWAQHNRNKGLAK